MFSSSMTFFTVYILGDQYTNRPAIQVCQYIPIVGLYIPITPISKCLNNKIYFFKSEETIRTKNTYQILPVIFHTFENQMLGNGT